jgi:hypothetical protein
MATLARAKAANLRILVAVSLNAALAVAAFSQVSRQLQVDVGPNQQLRIVAKGTSYGEVLRTLQKKLGWEIEIPVLADESKLSYAQVEAKLPQDALAKLLAGSGLDYAFTGGVNGAPLKVLVIPASRHQSDAAQGTVSSSLVSDSAAAKPSPTNGLGSMAVTVSTRDGKKAENDDADGGLGGPPRMPLSDAASAVGVPPGMSAADVGRMMTFTSADAAKIMGVPPGVLSTDVGRMTTFAASDAATVMGVPPGMSPDDVGRMKTFSSSDTAKLMGGIGGTPPENVGRTITLPLPSGSGKHP